MTRKEELLEPQEPRRAQIGFDQLEICALIGTIDDASETRPLTPAERRARELLIFGLSSLNLADLEPPT